MKKLISLIVLTLLLMLVLTSCRLISKIFNPGNNGSNEGNNAVTENHTCTWQIEAVIQEKSCVNDGIVNYSCSCGEKKTEITKALGHNFSDWENVSASTCESSGTDKQSCQICSAENFKILDKLSHEYSITEEETNGAIYKNYLCSNCSDSFRILSEIAAGFESSEPQYLFDCESSFAFDIVCGEDESYIRENLVIADTYFENSENEGADFAVCAYNLEEIEDGVWRVTPATAYKAGNTYKAKRSGGVVFKNYGANDLTFSIFKEETNVMEFNDGVIFLQALENKKPGYYPYTIEYSEHSGLYWVTLGRIDGLKIGDIVCVGDAESTEEVFGNYDSENTFGKIESISYSAADKVYYICMSVPNFDEVFDDIDIYSTKLEQIGEIEFADSDELASAVASALYNSKDFINFMGASYVTATEFLNNRGAVSSVGSFKDFLNSIRIDEKNSQAPKLDKATGTITAKVKIVGNVAIPVTVSGSGSARNVGNIVIQFSAHVNLDYLQLEVNFNQEEIDKADKEKLTKIKIGAIQSLTTGFTFNVAMDIDYSMEASPYVLNLSSRVYHFESCKHVAAMSDANIMRISAESLFDMINDGSLTASNECGTCRPVSAMKSDNYVLNKSSKTIHLYNCQHLSGVSSSNLLISGSAYGNLEASGYKACESCKPYSRYTNSFSESLLNKMQSGDFGHNIEEIKKLAEGADDSEAKKKIPVAEVPFIIGPCKVNFEIYVYINFTLEASLTYEYEQTTVTRYGFELKASKFAPYYSNNNAPKKNVLTITGETRLEVGALGIVRAGFVGFEKCLYASFNAECGMYAMANGALHQDFIKSIDNYMAAYFECGLACNIYGEIKIPFIKAFVFTFYNGDYPALKLGYERVVYKFTNAPTTIVIDSNSFSLNRNDLLTVTYFDLLDMKQGTAKLSYLGLSGRYTVNYTLKYGDNCYVKDGYIYVTDNSESFTDVLTVTVTGYDRWNDFNSNNTKIDLSPYTVTLTYNPIENCGLEFTSNGDGTCYVSGIGTCTDTYIEIPSISPAGDRVTGIGKDAFRNCDLLTSVVIPESVTSIGDGAFAFCISLTSIEIPDSVKSIDIGAFWDCISLTSVVIGDSVTSIGNSAFSKCTSLTSVVIGDSVTSIGKEVFSRCTSLTSITVAEGNKHYESMEGNLYTKGATTLVQYAIGKSDTSFVIPDSVESIADGAFFNCYSITSIVIPDSVESIGWKAFASCVSLESIVISNGVTRIFPYNMFEDCTSLTNVYYTGSEAEWATLGVEASDINNATIHYNYAP